MNNVNFLKPNKENLNLFLVLGALFFALGIFDFCANNPFPSIIEFEITSDINFIDLIESSLPGIT